MGGLALASKILKSSLRREKKKNRKTENRNTLRSCWRLAAEVVVLAFRDRMPVSALRKWEGPPTLARVKSVVVPGRTAAEAERTMRAELRKPGWTNDIKGP